MPRVPGVCGYCKAIAEDRCFYRDTEDEPFVIIESPSTDTPILIARLHVDRMDTLAFLTRAFRAMNELCERVMGYAYCLAPETRRGHFVIRSRSVSCDPFRVPSIRGTESMAESACRSEIQGGQYSVFNPQSFMSMMEGLSHV